MLKYFAKARKNPIDQTQKFYAQLAPVIPSTLEEIADNISNQCTVTVHDVKAVLSALQEQIYSALRDGRSVRLGDIGSFHPTLHSMGVDTKEALSVTNILGLRVRFTPAAKMRFKLSKTNPQVKFLNITPAAAASPQSPDAGDVQHEGSLG